MTTKVEQEMAFYSLLAAATRSVEIPESADVYRLAVRELGP